MGKNIIQIQADDGCIYVYDIDTNKLKKVCDIFEVKDIPQNVANILKKLNIKVDVHK